MTKIRVGVLRGGPSSEYDVSLKSGATVLKHLPEHYEPKDIFISKDGEWHIGGIAKSPAKILGHVDVVFNALHGEFGEDGKVQKILDSFNVPYTGSGVLASALGMNKVLSKNIFISHKLKTPQHVVVRLGQNIDELLASLFNSFLMPAVVKPAATGSSVGVTLVNYYNEIPAALERAFAFGDSALIEQYIAGREATCGVLDNFRDQEIYSLLPGEIIKPPHKSFFDYEAKYSGISREEFPGNFTEAEKAEIQRMAVAAHKALGLRHYSRSDFIIHPKRGIYILEANTLPGLTEQSLYPQSLEAVGCSMPDFIDHLLKLATESR